MKKKLRPLQEGKRKKGGVNPEPSRPKPDFTPPPQSVTKTTEKLMSIDKDFLNLLNYLGLTPSAERQHNVGESNYSTHVIQPWSIWLDYPELTSWDHDIIKRVLRSKASDSRQMDCEKIIHICEERIRQIELKEFSER